jgi:hypothetical protein
MGDNEFGVVTFNVAGTHFTATKDTLRSCAALGRMVLGGPPSMTLTRDPAGLPYVDADPQLFSHVMTFLRRGVLPASMNSSSELLVSSMSAPERERGELPCGNRRWQATQSSL